MSYVRHDKDCKEATLQPRSSTQTDDFGNTFKNWCVDFVGHDVKCDPNGKTGCAPQGPFSTWGTLGHWNYDVTAQRPLSKYVKSPTIVLPFIPIVGETILGLTLP